MTEGIHCKKVFFDGEDNRVHYIVFEQSYDAGAGQWWRWEHHLRDFKWSFLVELP